MVQRHRRRGHPVRRNGKTFWRNSHMVGDGAGPAAAGGGILVLLILAALVFKIGGNGDPSSDVAVESPSWSNAGITFTRTDSSTLPCGLVSYGKVANFLAEHPCTGLTRALFDAHDSQGHSMLVAVSWTDMPDAGQAEQLRSLADRSGSGNLTELTKNGVRFTGRHYDSKTAGSTTVIAEAEPLTGNPPVELLKQAATAALEAPRP